LQRVNVGCSVSDFFFLYTQSIAWLTSVLAEVFGKGGNADTVAAQWLSQYQRNNSEALRNLVNFILRCTGTDLEIDTDEVEDVDNAPSRIGDLQNLYQAEGIVDYPIISKAKKFKAFSVLLEEFTVALIQTFHASSILYTDDALLENIQIWISSLSTSKCRPFRHTATIISLSIMNALCDIAREVTTSVSTSRKQLESEKKKKTVNKGRVEAIQTAVTEGEQKVEQLDEFLQDGFDTVFVHRYRDIDGQIRAECLTALGGWIRTYREMFFEGQYLRYLGWTLADVVAQTRLVAMTELLSLYENRDNIAGLHSFTERFRQRIVEIAVQDADISVRMTAIELLNHLREGGLLEPNDIDAVGRLVFDLDPRIRKTAGRFFVSNVQDAYDAATEEVGEEINEVLAEDDDEDDYESPKHSWIKYKCLADLFQAYDAQETEHQPEPMSRGTLLGVAVESRFALATEAVFPHMEELAHWPSLAGYLLYDHSQIVDEPSEDDTAGVVKNMYKMQEGHESILLEVLCAAVKLRVLDVAKSDIDKRGRKTKALTAKISELQEEISHNLAQIIPQLLNKFGSTPETASVVLRLEHLVDLDTIQDLQKDATAYSSLLNDINKQFLTHSDQDVLAEASVAFLHAKSSEEMREALESKIQELWDDIIETLGALSQKKEVQEGGSISDPTLTDLANTVSRISNLAGITDCAAILEAVPNSRSKSKKDHIEAPFNILIRLAERGLRSEDDDEDTAKAETELVSSSIRTLLFYFMWKVQALSTALNDGKASFNTSYFEALTKSRETFASTLVDIMQTQPGLDGLRFTATTTYLDLQTLFSTLRNTGQDIPTDEDTLFQTQSLIHEISPETQSLITKIHSIAERTYAKKSRLNLEPADDDAPASEDDLDSEDEASDSEDETVTNDRLRSSITAEQHLCELTGKLVLAIIARVIDASGSRRGTLKKRLLRNKTALGHNYREVLSYLEEKKPRPSRAKGKQTAQTAEPKNAKSTERVVEDEELPEAVEEDEDEDLRARGLVEEDVVENGEEEEEELTPAPEGDEDEIMGD
jgi:cohesin complex subunit SA-1/2